MTLDDFRISLSSKAAPAHLSPALEALWWAGKGEWERAHAIVMRSEGDADAAWVHAYLHRVEGDIGNAHYWYRQARRPAAEGPLPAEWDRLVGTLLLDSRQPHR